MRNYIRWKKSDRDKDHVITFSEGFKQSNSKKQKVG